MKKYILLLALISIFSLSAMTINHIIDFNKNPIEKMLLKLMYPKEYKALKELKKHFQHRKNAPASLYYIKHTIQ